MRRGTTTGMFFSFFVSYQFSVKKCFHFKVSEVLFMFHRGLPRKFGHTRFGLM